MPVETMVQELTQQMDAAPWLSEDDREDLTQMLQRFRDEHALRVEEGLPPDLLAKWCADCRQGWLDFFATCREVSTLEDQLLQAQAKLGDANRTFALASLRLCHEMKTALESPDTTGTWEQRENLRAQHEKLLHLQPAFLLRITADDIRQLRRQGVL